ncbi:hypothetical protein NDU88_003406 [Pleurodeles waltl]|uniref:Uncharacterized protein n=1 Tax=Pleurodeles waltl TaxID=8319 RepID=A0AAV7RDU1_PLEWA|nr:hypothetical protein NDU88_003406 [Pleurodeles waltl]
MQEKRSVGSDSGSSWMAEQERGAEGCQDQNVGWCGPGTREDGEKTPSGEEWEGRLHLREDVKLEHQEVVQHADRYVPLTKPKGNVDGGRRDN